MIRKLIDCIKAQLKKFMTSNIVRCDFDRCYRVSEYNKALEYAKENIEVEGVREQIQNLQNEKKNYINNIESITNPERETENQKYALWEKWNRVGMICKGLMSISLLLIIIIFIILMVHSSAFLDIFFLIPVLVLLITIPVFLVAMTGTKICESSYSRYISGIMQKVHNQNVVFAQISEKYYIAIDDLYLNSLDPAYREAILTRREQAEHHKEMLRLEKERQEMERERLQEQKMARKAQERLVEIEEERERRRYR